MTVQRFGLRVLQLGFFVLIVWLVYRKLAPEFRQLSTEDLLRFRPSISLLLLSTAILTGVNLMHAFIWRAITVALTGATVSIRSAMRIFFVSSLGRYVPGKVWQLAGTAMLAQSEGVSAVAATSAALVGQLAFLTTGIVFLTVLLPSVFTGSVAWAAAGLVVMAVLLSVFAFTAAGRNLRNLVLERLGPRFVQGGALLDRLTISSTLRYWTLYAVSWMLVAIAFDLLVMAFVPERDLRRSAAIVAASYVSGYISLLPAGAVVRESVMATLLAPTVGAPAALLISVISRLWFTAGEMLPLIAVPFFPRPGKTA
jgi:glycosyltransferase 2 family protein